MKIPSTTKVLVIGAGPAGSTAAIRLAERGYEDVLMLDACRFPRQKPCAGGLSPEAFAFLKRSGLSGVVEAIRPAADMHTVVLTGPNGRRYDFTSTVKARVINRTVFDDSLRTESERRGARFVPRFAVRDLLTDAAGAVTGATDGTAAISADAVIVATGGHNRGFMEKYSPDRRPLRPMVSRIGWWEGFDIPAGYMEMVFDRGLSPHYGWVFPESDGRVNIGICCRGDRLGGSTVEKAFDSFLEKYYADRLAKAKRAGSVYNYPINVSSRVGRLSAPGVLFCGEAGRLCNPATAEGISYAMESGYLAAETLADAFDAGVSPRDRALKEYDRRCKKAFGFRLMRAKLLTGMAYPPVFNAMLSIATGRRVSRILDRMMNK